MAIEPLFEADRSPRWVALAVLASAGKVEPSGSSQERSLLRVAQNVAMQSMMKLGGAARYYVLDQLAQSGERLRTRRDADPLTAAFKSKIRPPD